MAERLAYKPAEFAEAIGCSRAKAYELIASGEVPSIKVGTDTRVPVQSAKDWMDKQLSSRRAIEPRSTTRRGKR